MSAFGGINEKPPVMIDLHGETSMSLALKEAHLWLVDEDVVFGVAYVKEDSASGL